MQITSDPSGVIHSWAVPSLGVKMDAIPGRLNETYLTLKSQACIMVNVLSYVDMGLCQSLLKQSQKKNLLHGLRAKEEFAENNTNEIVLNKEK